MMSIKYVITANMDRFDEGGPAVPFHVRAIMTWNRVRRVVWDQLRPLP